MVKEEEVEGMEVNIHLAHTHTYTHIHTHSHTHENTHLLFRLYPQLRCPSNIYIPPWLLMDAQLLALGKHNINTHIRTNTGSHLHSNKIFL